MKTLLIASFIALTSLAHASVTENFSQSYPINSDGSIKLDNVNGPVEIVAWDKNEVNIEAVKEASDEDALKHIQIKVESTPAQLVIKTEHDTTWKFWDRFQASVRYTLHVPTNSRLDKINTVNAKITVTGVHGAMNLDTVNGSIKATELRADARLESVNGSLTAEFDNLDQVKSVKLESVNGRLEITIPKDANANITTRSVNGSSHVDQAIKLNKSGRMGISGQIGTGGPAINL